jgi:hypothetical protein
MPRVERHGAPLLAGKVPAPILCNLCSILTGKEPALAITVRVRKAGAKIGDAVDSWAVHCSMLRFV